MPIYENENEKRLHLNAVEILSRRNGAPPEEIERLYEIVLMRFKREAKVKDFLPILVTRRVEYLMNVRKNRRILNK